MPSTLRRRHYLLREETPSDREHLGKISMQSHRHVLSVPIGKVVVKLRYEGMCKTSIYVCMNRHLCLRLIS